MAPKSKTESTVLDRVSSNGTNPERERVFAAYRQWGYLEGDLDPLGFLKPRPTPELERDGEYAREARSIYSSTIGVEINHIYSPERRRWVYERMETGLQPNDEEIDRARILELLTRADIFEQVMQQRYLGSKRFSLEGTTALIPLVDEVLDTASGLGAIELVMGMSHRGRLNVIAHVAKRPAEEIFAGFEDVDPRSVLGSGDVKYHMGATGEYITRGGGKVHIHLVSNPSHLEAVDPVTVGRTRAKQDRTGEGGREKYLPLLVHGDAAFAGQGVLAETMNYADLPGYTVGGTIHVVVNNLLGFTTSYTEEHSTRFAACIARRQSIPIFHVNAEDVDAVVRVARLATEYRYQFGTDVVIDLIGYRRHGHSEVDDPTITQPLLYKKIKDHPPLWEIYADDIGDANAKAKADTIRVEFEEAQKKTARIKHKPLLRELPKYWDHFFGGLHRDEYEVETGLASEELAELTTKLTTYPEGFHIHPKVKKLLEQRAEMGAGKRLVDYGMAEALAFASLVKTGTHVRMSGQDSRRGTFNQRHSVLIDTENENEYVPLENIAA
ncbi:MAG TPA: thiamine pyrophosphate-dependent enzyme, partial [Terriglobales bacterium]|nr:thiamine pyrophosphate-dependent enzyme [Terriglobales bacterium]